MASNGRNMTAIVVDECDSRRGCDEEHAYQRHLVRTTLLMGLTQCGKF